MKLWKKLSVFCLSVLTVGSISFAVGCAGEEDSSSSSSSSESSAPDPEKDFIYPADDAAISWLSPTGGTGGEYDRYECKEGYYEFTVSATETFYSFSVRRSGVYALYSINGGNGVTVNRYDASVQYIPMTSTGVLIGEEAEKDGSNFYSRVNCSQNHYNGEWRATFGIKAETETKVKVRFVRIADPLPDPVIIETSITPTQIKGVAGKPENRTPVTVPFTASWYYDENATVSVTPIGGGAAVEAKGFYRVGDPENKKTTDPIIYMAITTKAARMFDKTFAGDNAVQYEGNNLSLSNGKNENGAYLKSNYVDFFMNNGGVKGNTADKTKLCYENVVNADGLYPVNRELFDFLNLYVSNNPPMGRGETDESVWWLASCFYYDSIEQGTKAYPHELKIGDNTVQIEKKFESGWYTVKWSGQDGAGRETNTGFYKISTEDTNAAIRIEEQTFYGPFEIAFEADSVTGRAFEMLTVDGEIGQFDVTVEKAGESAPVELTSGSEKTLTATAVFYLETEADYGKVTEYIGVYKYTAAADGTLKITCDTKNVTVLIDGTPLSDGMQEIEVKAGQDVWIYVQATVNLPDTGNEEPAESVTAIISIGMNG